MAHAEHEQVRQRFSQRCGYCGVSEVDAGGPLTVDHYHPLAAGSENIESLVYACFKCNQFKGDFSPITEDLAYESACYIHFVMSWRLTFARTGTLESYSP